MTRLFECEAAQELVLGWRSRKSHMATAVALLRLQIRNSHFLPSKLEIVLVLFCRYPRIVAHAWLSPNDKAPALQLPPHNVRGTRLTMPFIDIPKDLFLFELLPPLLALLVS
jgi:hypothetical protein